MYWLTVIEIRKQILSGLSRPLYRRGLLCKESQQFSPLSKISGIQPKGISENIMDYGFSITIYRLVSSAERRTGGFKIRTISFIYTLKQ